MGTTLDARTRVHRVVRSAKRRTNWWLFFGPLEVVSVVLGLQVWNLVDPRSLNDTWSFLRGFLIGVAAVAMVTFVQINSWNRYLTKLREAPSSEVDVVAWWLWLQYPEYGSKKSGLGSKKAGLREAVRSRGSLLVALVAYGEYYAPPVEATNSDVLHAYDVAASVSDVYAGLLVPLKSVQYYMHKSEGWRDLSRGYERVARLIERYRDEPAMLARAAKFCEVEGERVPYGSDIEIDERYDRVEKTLERVRRSG